MTRHTRLFRDRAGAMAIETGIVLPVLALLSIGSFQVSEMVVRQHELQAAAAEAEQIALASAPDTQAKLNVIKSILMTSTGLPTSNVTVAFQYRCGTAESLVSSSATCGSAQVWTFVHIVLTDTYSPTWTHLGIGSDVTLTVDRTVQIG